jgi:opacity protein-like surface antigen
VRTLGVMIVLLLLLFFSLFLSQSKAAELYIYGGIGQASSAVTDKRGLWKHDGQPYEYDGKTMGFRTGLGSSFALDTLGTLGSVPFSHGVSMELGAVSLGSPEMVESWFNADDSYDKRGRCYKKCNELYTFNLVNDYLGGELVAKYGITAWDWLTVYATGGLAGFSHQHSGTLTKQWAPKRAMLFSHDGNTLGQNFSGMMLAGVIGGGVCGKVYHFGDANKMVVALCGDVEKFLPFAHTANPLVNDGLGGPVLTTFQVRVPLMIF